MPMFDERKADAPTLSPAGPSYILGLDLGQSQDYSALAVLERSDDGKQSSYACRHLHRWKLGTPYTQIAAELAGMVAQPPLMHAELAIDQTGVGRPVVELVRQTGLKAALTPITITGGTQTTREEDGSVHCPKRQLVSVLQVLLQSQRLKIASALPMAEVLTKELMNFKVKITAAGNEVMEAWRERDHDDLVLAVALAAWVAEYSTVRYGPPTEPERGIEDRMKSAGLGRLNVPEGGWLNAQW